ncbi:molybdopterin-synthase adenylyltransferase MoeB [Notoacmeibacter ruber]|uniref:Molybdopterin-synthase adenylyltransferase n=1 Tax=Notoacmeibacter ruber TaxID=2670375 RepID=A0A3L7J8K9_9HYPH|nr:molybdopterin-synthase adenylyltransferase MoeB [Notoacmeibacter ruber]RLQ87013.1 molybdopterin-synthase adenylyltransferase MoeB [Notoacmeibacter ruber]
MTNDALDSDELRRYARHIILPEIGGPGQQKLKAARVLVIGAGGLGAPVLLYLAAAGVGTLGVIDDDIVSLSNLQRQIIHATDDIDRKKVDSAADVIKGVNPHVRMQTHAMRLSEDNADELIANYDIVVDGSDNFTTRYLLADLCAAKKVTLVTGAVGRFDGSLTVLQPWREDAEGRLNPTYRDLFPEPPAPGTVPSCAEAGVIGALTGVIGTLQAMEVIKLITGAGEPLIGRLLLYDSLAARFETIRYRRSRKSAALAS